ncbi:hypothetical protein LZD49_29515 [Dyadobacter sp. CY261]|uniref:hypothetical protein n=1 Tax=Dyadobacter sp. CY261 TaxID=2907203 RepID=UPI001F1F36A0|nr:hypothetical protein [Dyadobacter sp. CY261]MCF0074660.1 hypothetical protein [Dyadobacter sp. CY261]
MSLNKRDKLYSAIDHPKGDNTLIQKLRAKHKYRSHIMYRSRDKFKRPISLALIDLFFQEPSLRFYGRIIQEVTNTSQKYLVQIRQSAYNATYRKAVVDVSGLANSKSLKMNFYSSQEALIKELTTYARSRSIILADERLGNNLLQLSDLFTGSIYGELFGKPRNPTKIAITDYLKKRLGVSDLKQLRNIKSSKFLLAGI